MTTKNIVICDLEKDYGKRLLEALNEKTQKGLKFFLFHDLNLLEEFINNESVSCLVLDSEISVETRAEMIISNKIVLARSENIAMGESETKVRKYQHIDEIYKTILKSAYQLEVDKAKSAWEPEEHNCIEGEEKEIGCGDAIKESKSRKDGRNHKKGNTCKGVRLCKEREHEETRDNIRECKVIGVYSPIHRIGKTRFAIELGQELAKEGPVLYLNMEPFAPGSYFKDRADDNLERLIYNAGQGHKNLGLCASMMASQLEEMDYIEPMAVASDLFNVSGTMWKEVIDRIIDESIYETIILDLSDGINDLFSILEYCHVVYTLYIEEPIALAKLKQYTENLLRTGHESVLEHTIQKKVEM